MMLTVRTNIGLTQTGLAEFLEVSRRAVGEWEAGGKYPKIGHLKQFIVLAVKHQAFHVGNEAEEIRALWQAAHQKVLLDELWLARLLSDVPVSFPSKVDDETNVVPGTVHKSENNRRVDWGDALAIHKFYGREWELSQLTGWVVQARCRVVSVLGMGGMGKSALSVHLMYQVAEDFDVVIWRSLRDAPTCEALLDDCFRILAPKPPRQLPHNLEQRLNLFFEYLRDRRALVVLDNLEALLDEGERAGPMRPEHVAYESLLRRVAETEHQSCLLLTSREKLLPLLPFEGTRSPVRALRLAQLESKPCEQLLDEKDIAGNDSERARLINAYGGNPLALKIVAQTIIDLFDGEIGPFLD